MVEIAPYNAAMFKAYASAFLVCKDRYGKDAALGVMRQMFQMNLEPAYGTDFQKGSTQDAARVIGERDAGVGLDVRFPVIEENRLVYEFHTDPFPTLKGKVDPREFDACYMRFKVNHLLGPDWTYAIPEHIWENGEFTQHVITRKK
ncbi:hypothetical protein ACFLQN_03040 [Candidatus Aenigmatarchaeota archaeon]